MPRTEKGEIIPLITLPETCDNASPDLHAGKRAWLIRETTEAIGLSILRDAQAFARIRVIPAMGSPKRRVWEQNRGSMIESFIRLYQLDKDVDAKQLGWSRPPVIIDVPANPSISAPDAPK